MATKYIPTEWKNGTSPALNANNLNHIEQGIKNLSDDVNAIEQTVQDNTNRIAEIENGNTIPCSTKDTLGGVRVEVIDNGDGTYTGKIWTCN